MEVRGRCADNVVLVHHMGLLEARRATGSPRRILILFGSGKLVHLWNPEDQGYREVHLD